MTTHTNHNGLKKDLQDLFKPRSEETEVKHDALMLMAGFLSEIEAIQNERDISRKELAQNIKGSGSYLTQVFRSKKPLNFITLAKICRALNIRFDIKAVSKTLPASSEAINHQYNPLPLNAFVQDFLSKTSDTIPAAGSEFDIDQTFFSIDVKKSSLNKGSKLESLV
jgi:DNA-binding Xre family transcriptional regulator